MSSSFESVPEARAVSNSAFSFSSDSISLVSCSYSRCSLNVSLRFLFVVESDLSDLSDGSDCF